MATIYMLHVKILFSWSKSPVKDMTVDLEEVKNDLETVSQKVQFLRIHTTNPPPARTIDRAVMNIR